jgi:hypothetical protein
MVVFSGPLEFLMGSPFTEAGRYPQEQLYRQRIDRTFAIATKSVTVQQFRRFDPHFGHSQMHICPEPDCPILGLTWYEATAYCNWLSEQEGLPEDEKCYVPNKNGQFAEGMQLAPEYLRRTGYRLPTEAEWEYACRAGAVTARYYGETDQLLEKYAWFLNNSATRSWPVGGLKPNDFGLFDMHGNVWGWCQERYKHWIDVSGQAGIRLEDKEDTLSVVDKESRVLRGGSFSYLSMHVRSADRTGSAPSNHNSNNGFRPARTFR